MRLSKGRSSAPFISLANATFRLADRLVFEDTTWTFRRDEHWAVIGPNGSGKSLFGDAVRGNLPLVGGDLNYHFVPSKGLSAVECIGHVAFQDRKAALHGSIVQSRWNSIEDDPARTVREFLSYEHVMEVNPFEVTNFHQTARPAFERRLRQAAKLAGIERFFEQDLLTLSNGETQRVHLARALALPLRLLILDEPFTGLDAEGRISFSRILENLMQTRLKILLITTREEDLPGSISHVLRLENCQIRFAGPHRLSRTQSECNSASLSAACSQDFKSSAASPRRRRSEVIVELRNVSVSYGSNLILDRIDWTIRSGESWALLGPNGSGKTTLLSLILGDNPQAYGNDVTVFGRQRGLGESIWEIKRDIGWVSPEMHLHFDESITCLEAVVSGFYDTMGLFEPMTRRQRDAARKWLARFQLKQFAHNSLFELSVGLQRMVLLARALVKCPRLLILDEPCQGLDQAHRDLFIRVLDHLLRSGKETAIYVTHRHEEIPPSIRRILRLEARDASWGTRGANPDNE